MQQDRIDAIRQQASYISIDPDQCRHMVSPGHNELRQLLQQAQLWTAGKK